MGHLHRVYTPFARTDHERPQAVSHLPELSSRVQSLCGLPLQHGNNPRNTVADPCCHQLPLQQASRQLSIGVLQSCFLGCFLYWYSNGITGVSTSTTTLPPIQGCPPNVLHTSRDTAWSQIFEATLFGWFARGKSQGAPLFSRLP